MPWTTKSPPDSYKNFDTKRLAKAIRIANSVYKSCLDRGGSDKKCAPKAIRIGAAQSK